MSANITNSPPRAPPVKYTAPLGTRWEKERAAAGQGAFDLHDDPKRIGPWIIGECVGKGASGRVKIAKHCVTGQLAAVKILPLQPLFNSRASLATQQSKADKQRFGIDREITMMKLMNHPNIMRIYDAYEGPNDLFLVLEYVEGGELFDFLVNRGRLAPLEALAYFKQIIYGLNYAHTFSIIHRDLKPENILIHSLNPPLIKIADWGMAAFAPPSLHLETSCGSPHYASPEIVNGEKYKGNATDIWSCGVILFALLTGRLPFDDKNVRHLLAKVKVGKFEMPDWIDRQAKDLIARMLVVDVTRRITIPEILAHPWMLIDTPGITYVPAPPPHELARPLRSAAHIDPELLESLRVIWGRHADSKGDSIRWDLLSPAGQGTLAKAFYFLLDRYRERVQSDTGRTSTEDELKIARPYVALPVKASPRRSRRAEVRSSRIAPAPPAAGHYSSHTRAATANPGPAIVTVHPLTAPAMSRTGTSSRSRTSSPAGPRPISGIYEKNARPTSALTPAAVERGHSDIGHRRTLARPPIPTRAHTYTMNDAPLSVRFPEQFQVHPERPCATSLRRQSSIQNHVLQPAGNRARVDPTPPVINPSRFSFAPLDNEIWDAGSTDPCIMSPPISHAPIIHAPTPLPANTFIAPKSDNPEFQKAMDEIADKVNVLMAKGHAQDQVRRGFNHKQAASGKENDKENRSLADEGWSCVQLNDDCQSEAAVKKGKDRISRNYTSKQGANTLPDSPILLTSQPNRTFNGTNININGSANVSRGSPVVGEFKGWFSNLFNWKNQSGSNILYSPDDVATTRKDVGVMLEDYGVSIESLGADMLRCRVDDGDLGGLKHARFRIEFVDGSVASAGPRLSQYSPNPNLHTPPALNQRSSTLMSKTGHTASPASNGLPPWCVCAVVFIHEKGSFATFKNVWRHLRQETLGRFVAPSVGMTSPIITAPQPGFEQPQRFVF